MELLEKGKDGALNILESIRSKKLVRRYLVLMISLFISACYFNLLQLPSQIVTGGSSGVSIILNSLLDMEPSKIVFAISIILLFVGLIFLGFEKASGAVVYTFIYPIFLELTKDIGNIITVDLTDKILISIFIGVFYGFTTGVIYKVGFSHGGFSIISEIIAKYKKIPISNISFFINLIIVIIGGVSFGWTMVMYAVIALYIYGIVLDRVLIGVSKNKALYIITSEEERMRDYIMNELKHGVTIFDVHSGFLEKKRKVLMTVIPNRDYFRLKEGINEIDMNSFFIVTDAYQVYGGE